MKIKSDMTTIEKVAFTARLCISVLFIISGISKFGSLNSFIWEIVSLKLFYWILAKPIAILIPILECSLGLMLLLGLFIKFDVKVLTAMTIFRAFVAYHAQYNLDAVSCKCFGYVVDVRYGAMYFIFLFILTAVLIFIGLKGSTAGFLQPVLFKKKSLKAGNI